MPHILYDKETVLEIIAEYLTDRISKEELALPVAVLYSNIVDYASKEHNRVKMPKFAQARKLIIADLTEYSKYNQGERFTSEVMYRLKELYYRDDDIDSILQHKYAINCYTEDVIICTVKLPSTEVMQMLTEGISGEKGKSELWGKINTIQKICTCIKKRDSDNILAVIPEFNRVVYLNDKGLINSNMKNLDPICDTLCMFVKNTPEGKAIVKSMNQAPHSLIVASEADSS